MNQALEKKKREGKKKQKTPKIKKNKKIQILFTKTPNCNLKKLP